MAAFFSMLAHSGTDFLHFRRRSQTKAHSTDNAEEPQQQNARIFEL